MTSIVCIASTDYQTTGDTLYEFVGPFRDHEKAREFAEKFNARVDKSNHGGGYVSAEAISLDPPKINAAVAGAKAWLEGQKS